MPPNDPQPGPAQPTFRVVKKAQIPIKRLAALMREAKAAQAIIPRIYELMMYAQDKAVESEVKLSDEAARVLGFDGRHELRAECEKNKWGFEADDQTGEVRLYETIAPESPPVESPAVVQEPTLELVETCRHCNRRVAWSQVDQMLLHVDREGTVHERMYCGIPRAGEEATKAQLKERK